VFGETKPRDQGIFEQVEKVLRHCALWCPVWPQASPAEHGWVHDPDGTPDVKIEK
jgi:hypothetical protein